MKRIKMCLYGEPGVGKSVFASKFPKPFFITTDGNYEWLIDFGAKEEDHARVGTWSEAKKLFNASFDGYETIVVDLTEDLFKWCEYEYCKRNGIEHMSDLGFGKAYDATRNEFFIEICKLLNLDKHVVLIMHGYTYTVKDRRGIEHTRYAPSNRIPDKVLDMIEGRVRYFLRCYLKAVDIDGKLVKKRYLSVVPKENEFGIIRGVNENSIPTDIELDFNAFANIIGLEMSQPTVTEVTTTVKKSAKTTPVIKDVKLKSTNEEKVEAVKETTQVEKVEEPKVVDTPKVVEQPKVAETPKVVEPVTQVEEPKVVEQPKSQDEKLAAIKAKLAALKNRK